ncbi:ABC transporter permease [Aquabacterium sp. OR-4]|uniref:ABC transporter permease n=1 Tax=Aquabacterium sp. OR-4 TaxID=2978127 RepID=UPI0021B3D76E|nr:ABC transporter permease [Aquabacterium sp. OR-4]MDT7838074.1 ABC transporter permease [Aquabacterium sp. OR-4]
MIGRLAATARFAAVVALTYLGLLAATFFIGRVMPIDPVIAIVGDRAPEHVVQRVRAELGLDRPLTTQFAIYVRKALSGDLGTSVLTARPVAEDIRKTFPATLELATCGILIGAGLGVPLGVWAAVRRGGWADQAVRVMALVGYSVPIFWLGLMALLVFYAKLGWVGGPGRIDVAYEFSVPTVSGLLLVDAALAGEWEAFGNALGHLVLPASLLGYFSLAYIARMTRSFMLHELAQEYIVAARAKGLSEARIIWRHALRNAMVPLVTVIALSYAGLLEGSVLTETVFAWPGLGQYLTNSLQNADMNAVLGATLVVGTVFIALNLLSDLLYRVLDPRTRAR